MRYIIVALLFIALTGFFQGCDYVEILYQDDKIVVEERWVDDFEEIRVEIPVELELVQNNEQIAIVSGPDYKVSNLLFRIENNVLVLERKTFMYERRAQVLKIQLPIKTLKRITLNMPTTLISKETLSLDKFVMIVNGPGTYSESNLNLNCKTFTLAAYGKNSGHHILKGTTDELRLTMEGIAWTNAEQLISSRVSVTQRSLKSSYVHAEDNLIVRMYSAGHVYFTGQPQLDFQVVEPDWEVKFGSAIKQDD